MTGWCQHLQIGGFRKPEGVIAISVSQSFPDAALIRQTLEEGIARVPPETVWVMREAPAANHAVSIAWATLREHGIEPILSSIPNAIYHGKARDYADAELFCTTERFIIFHDGRSGTTKKLADKKNDPTITRVFVVERGVKKAKSKTKRRVEE